ncbi:ABC transporter substrate-binding protein [Rhizobium sp. SYY.PMSO]|uniref:ABC transporter substrate-binding protein n=1 Tax=Rhizobium sp. SYY.PMSO TaxID=3382192 RepID=UPI00398FE7A7
MSLLPLVRRSTFATGLQSPRLAAPDRGAAQTVLALGLVPLVSVSREFFDAMGTEPPMPDGVVDCGDPSEPNLEVIRKMNVDLIVTSTITADIRNVLGRVAAVHALQIYTGLPDTLERAKTETLKLAAEIGRTEACQNYLRAQANLLELSHSKLSSWKRRPVYLIGLAPDGRNMTVYGRNSLMWDVMIRLGVENAWHGETNVFGFANAGIERLADQPDAAIVSIDYGAITQSAFATLAQSPFWVRLPAVQAHRVYSIKRFEVFGGLPAATQFAPLLTDVLLSTAI